MKVFKKKIFNRAVVLEKLSEIGETTFENLLTTSANLPAIFDPRRGINWTPRPKYFSDFKAQNAFRAMLSKLKSQGLVVRPKRGLWQITSKGLSVSREHPAWIPKYQPIQNSDSKSIILVIFDIPELLRHKRAWLRFQLTNLGFSPLQMSVWQGNSALPEDFINDLNRYKIKSYVHIFSVNKTGTLAGN